MRTITPDHDTVDVRSAPIGADGIVARGGFGTLEARRLDHGVEAFGYHLVEPDGRRMLPDRLAAAGVHGPDVGHLARDGVLRRDGQTVALEEVRVPRPVQRFAFVMDTRLCDAVYALADGDLLVIESTFLSADEDLAVDHGHLTAAQAGRVAAGCGARRLVLTHFSQRYPPIPRHSGPRPRRSSAGRSWWRPTWTGSVSRPAADRPARHRAGSGSTPAGGAR